MKQLSAVLALIALSCTTLSAAQEATQNPSPAASRVHTILARHFDENPPVHFELAPSDKVPGRALVTNTYQAALTAFALQVDAEAGSQRPPQIEVFDSASRVGMISSIPRGLTLIIGIPHIVGKPIPAAKIAAAVWEDGSSFGPPEIVEQLVANRRATLAAYDLVVSVLQTAVKENWTPEQCADALEKQKTAPPVLSEIPRVAMPSEPNTTITSVQISLRSAHSPKPELIVKTVLGTLEQTREQLAASLPPDSQHKQADR